MGVDLTLLPFDFEDGRFAFAHSVLNVERRRELWGPIAEYETRRDAKVPDDFSSYLSRDGEYEDAHYGKTLETPYGEPLRYVLVADLMTFSESEEVTDNAKNRAVWAYLRELPPDTKVALYWH